jgi:hypothetical protein
MHHPSESDLALYAGNDLSRIVRLRVDWHLRTCGKCQQEVTEFSSLRAETVRNAPEPDVNWDRLAAEMKANIRLGLEAGECIGPVHVRHRGPSRWAWAALATAALMVVAAGSGIWINHPGFLGMTPGMFSDGPSGKASLAGMPLLEDVVLEGKDSGIQMRDGEAVVSELRNNSRSGSDVVYSVNAQGGVGASYVDREGMVTVNNIYYGQ